MEELATAAMNYEAWEKQSIKDALDEYSKGEGSTEA
jgi:hypothetical protein